METRKIAVDFDGTIVEDNYPSIGRERPFALRTLRALQEKGFLLILWTCRTGKQLDEAVEFCQKGGVEFYGINNNFIGETDGDGARKIDADIYIDDRNFGGLPSWGEIFQQLTGDGPNGQGSHGKHETKSSDSGRGLLRRFGDVLVGR